MSRRTCVPSRKHPLSAPERRFASPRSAPGSLLSMCALCAALACADGGYRRERPGAEGGAGAGLFPSLTRPGSAGTPGLGTPELPEFVPGSAGMAGTGGTSGLGVSGSSGLGSDAAGSSGSSGFRGTPY